MVYDSYFINPGLFLELLAIRFFEQQGHYIINPIRQNVVYPINQEDLSDFLYSVTDQRMRFYNPTNEPYRISINGVVTYLNKLLSRRNALAYFKSKKVDL